MPARASRSLWRTAAIAATLAIASCSGGGGSDSSPPGSPPPPSPPPPAPSGAFATKAGTSHFLSQATFGPSEDEIDQLTGTSPEDWLVAEFNKPASLYLPYVQEFLTRPGSIQPDGEIFYIAKNAPTWAFWTHAIDGDDQLRQRVAFALSQIIVVSHLEGNLQFEIPTMMAYYQDILTRNAFGNYRDLLEEITYSPAMAEYLTYFRNLKEDPDSGRMPDENYARELMQLFTIGLVELNMDGTPRTDGSGEQIETYDNDDITGLAKVFTGLSFDAPEFFFDYENLDPAVFYSPLKAFPEFHSESEKVFLGTTIPENTPAEQSIDQALDTIFAHPNVAPFVSRQLIQRLVTSHPEPDYIQRVATVFEAGAYTLPSGASVGDGRRGDMKATIAAILFDEDARGDSARAADDFGKVREPVIRIIHWARAFDAANVTPEHSFALFNTGGPNSLGQGPFKSPSVFNFYRPGYVAPATETGAAGLTMPELQIVNAGTVASSANVLSYFTFGLAEDFSSDPDEANTLLPDYSDEIALADDPDALLDHLDEILTYGSMSTETKTSISAVLSAIPLENPNDPDYDGPAFRAALAVTMVMTSPDYIVQR